MSRHHHSNTGVVAVLVGVGLLLGMELAQQFWPWAAFPEPGPMVAVRPADAASPIVTVGSPDITVQVDAAGVEQVTYRFTATAPRGSDPVIPIDVVTRHLLPTGMSAQMDVTEFSARVQGSAGFVDFKDRVEPTTRLQLRRYYVRIPHEIANVQVEVRYVRHNVLWRDDEQVHWAGSVDTVAGYSRTPGRAVVSLPTRVGTVSCYLARRWDKPLDKPCEGSPQIDNGQITYPEPWMMVPAAVDVELDPKATYAAPFAVIDDYPQGRTSRLPLLVMSAVLLGGILAGAVVVVRRRPRRAAGAAHRRAAAVAYVLGGAITFALVHQWGYPRVSARYGFGVAMGWLIVAGTVIVLATLFLASAWPSSTTAASKSLVTADDMQ